MCPAYGFGEDVKYRPLLYLIRYKTGGGKKPYQDPKKQYGAKTYVFNEFGFLAGGKIREITQAYHHNQGKHQQNTHYSLSKALLEDVKGNG
jgi:hypothetical protein